MWLRRGLDTQMTSDGSAYQGYDKTYKHCRHPFLHMTGWHPKPNHLILPVEIGVCSVWTFHNPKLIHNNDSE